MTHLRQKSTGQGGRKCQRAAAGERWRRVFGTSAESWAFGCLIYTSLFIWIINIEKLDLTFFYLTLTIYGMACIFPIRWWFFRHRWLLAYAPWRRPCKAMPRKRATWRIFAMFFLVDEWKQHQIRNCNFCVFWVYWRILVSENCVWCL